MSNRPAAKARIELVDEPIDAAVWIEWATVPEVGAVVSFLGTVRNHHRGRDVLRLDYSAYPEMALVQMNHLATELAERWPSLERIAIAHRLGSLEISEASIVIVLSLAHRKDGFAALEHAIDRFKEIVPIWKKEHFSDGVTEWVHQSS